MCLLSATLTKEWATTIPHRQPWRHYKITLVRNSATVADHNQCLVARTFDELLTVYGLQNHVHFPHTVQYEDRGLPCGCQWSLRWMSTRGNQCATGKCVRSISLERLFWYPPISSPSICFYRWLLSDIHVWSDPTPWAHFNYVLDGQESSDHTLLYPAHFLPPGRCRLCHTISPRCAT